MSPSTPIMQQSNQKHENNETRDVKNNFVVSHDLLIDTHLRKPIRHITSPTHTASAGINSSSGPPPYAATSNNSYNHTANINTPATQSSSKREKSSPTNIGFVGHLLIRKPSSVAFFIELLSADSPSPKSKSPILAAIENAPIHITEASPRSLVPPSLPTPTKKDTPAASPTQPSELLPKPSTSKRSSSARSSLSFPVIEKEKLRPSPIDMKENLEQRLSRASESRNQILKTRRDRLMQYAEQIRCRTMIQRQRDRIHMLQLQAKYEYTMTAASLKRQMLLRRMQERFAAAVEHARSVMLMQKLRKFLELRRAFSENIADILRDNSDLSGGLAGKARLFFSFELMTVLFERNGCLNSIYICFYRFKINRGMDCRIRNPWIRPK